MGRKYIFTKEEEGILQETYDENKGLDTKGLYKTFDDFLYITDELIYNASRISQIHEQYKWELGASKSNAERVKRELAALCRAIDNLSPAALAHLSPYSIDKEINHLPTYGEQLKQIAAVIKRKKYTHAKPDFARHYIARAVSTIFLHFRIEKSEGRADDLHEYLSLVVRLSKVNLNVHSLTLLTAKTRGGGLLRMSNKSKAIRDHSYPWWLF